MAGVSSAAAGSQANRAQSTDTPRLTPREVEVLAHIAQGMTSRQVADKLFVSKRTVDFHLDGIYAKLEVTNRMQAIREAERLGLLDSVPIAQA